jgi:hypothetical protein
VESAAWSRVPEACSEYLARLQAHGIRVLMRIDPLPTPKLIGRAPTTPQELELAKTYTRSIVAQLKPYVEHWQLGNEPNLANAPERYVQVFAELARVVRAEQPSAVIYGPGVGMLQCLAKEPYPWLAQALKAGLLKHVDVFSFHPYRANGDPPESASEFARWRHWKSYGAQLDVLRTTLRAAGMRSPERLAVTEDGQGTPISASGEQQVTELIDAKHELRRSLLDFAQGISPRLHFTFYRSIPEATYSYEGSFNTMSRSFELKPLYYAVQNLHAVLDGSYEKTQAAQVSIRAQLPKLLAAEPRVQTYLKHHAGFDELLIFFWAPVFAQNMHLRVPIDMDIEGDGWEAPVLIDLMTMPGNARPLGHQPSEHRRTTFPAAKRAGKALRLDTLELRDYPQLLKLVRVARSATE